MRLLKRVAGLFARAFPNHVSVLSRTFEEYPLADETRVILTLAQQDALAYGQIHATPERTLLVALEDDGFASHVASRSGVGAIEALREALLLALASPKVAAESRAIPRSPRLTLTLGHALERMRRRGATKISRGDLLVGLASTEGETSCLLVERSGSAERLDEPTRSALPAPAGADAEALAIYVLNDDLSTMEDVMRILEQGFGLSVRRAFHRMMTAHHVGHAHVGTFSRREAEERLASAHRHAEARGSKVRFYRGAATPEPAPKPSDGA